MRTINLTLPVRSITLKFSVSVAVRVRVNERSFLVRLRKSLICPELLSMLKVLLVFPEEIPKTGGPEQMS